MNLLILGPERTALAAFISAYGDTAKSTEDKVTGDHPLIQWADFLISYGYRHIIKSDVLDKFPRKAINLHISFLPWNRGADPNLWSFLENTPKGITIHYLDRRLDTGDILAQREVMYDPGDTLRTSYNRLTEAIELLFMKTWPDIRAGTRKSIPQTPGGTSHRLRDRGQFEHLLTHGWDTPVADLIGQALAVQSGRKE
jgi:methionyl-tRNA formyltransferase